MSIVSGINEPDLGTLCMEILDYSDRVSSIFDKIDRKMNTLSDYYIGTSKDELLTKYMNFRNSYNTVKKNICTYSDDLVALIQKMKNNSEEIESLFVKFTDDRLLDVQKLNNKGGN